MVIWRYQNRLGVTNFYVGYLNLQPQIPPVPRAGALEPDVRIMVGTWYFRKRIARPDRPPGSPGRIDLTSTERAWIGGQTGRSTPYT